MRLPQTWSRGGERARAAWPWTGVPKKWCIAISNRLVCSPSLPFQCINDDYHESGFDSRVISPWPIGPRTLGPRTLSPWHHKSQGPMGQGPKVWGTLSPQTLGPWDLRCLRSNVRGPKARGPKVHGTTGPRPLGLWDLRSRDLRSVRH